MFEDIYNEAFNDEIEKIAKEQKLTPTETRMSNAFYHGMKRIDSDRRKASRKKMLVGTGAVAATGAAAYGAGKLGFKGFGVKDKIKSKIYSSAERAGRVAGIASGKATNAASSSFSKTVKGGLSRTAGKFRGGSFVAKAIKKVMFKG